MKQILINVSGMETRVAVVDNGILADYFIERRDDDHLVGSIFKGRISNLEPSLQAAFVDIGSGKNAFLHYWDMLPATQDMLEDEGGRREEEAAAEAAALEEEKPEEKAPVERPKRMTLFAFLKEKLFPSAEAEARAEQPTPANTPAPQQHRQRHRRKPHRPQVTVDDIPNLFKPNSEVLVQVTKGPIGTKGARVTTNLSIPGRNLVLLPNSTHVGVSKRIESGEERDRLRRLVRQASLAPGMGAICRTVAAGRPDRAILRELDMLKTDWLHAEEASRRKQAPCFVYQEPHLVERSLRDYLTEDIEEVITDSKPTYDQIQELMRRFAQGEGTKVRHYNSPKAMFQKYNLSDQIDNIFARKVMLPGGGYICIDETEALIAIDVNSGKNRAGKDHPETILNTNLEAVQEVARQLRLRNIGGLIVVDFIDMRARRDQQTVYRAIKDAVLADRARTKIMQISPLGLLEMTRQREQESLRDAVYNACPYCNGRGIVKSAVSVSIEIQRRLEEILRRHRNKTQIRVTVHPVILKRLKDEDADMISDIERDFTGELSFRADENLHMEEFKVNDAASGEEL